MTAILRASPAAEPIGRPTRTRTLGTVLKGWWAVYRRWAAEQAAVARLHAMSDRQLRDIGITRSQIEFVLKVDVERDRICGRGL